MVLISFKNQSAGIFFVFGTFMAGPAYHYWFNYLDELPAAVYRLKQLKTRSTLLHSFSEYLMFGGIFLLITLMFDDKFSLFILLLLFGSFLTVGMVILFSFSHILSYFLTEQHLS